MHVAIHPTLAHLDSDETILVRTTGSYILGYPDWKPQFASPKRTSFSMHVCGQPTWKTSANPVANISPEP